MALDLNKLAGALNNSSEYATYLGKVFDDKGSDLNLKALNILRKYGSDAHAYIPGVGAISGLTAGNYLDSAGTQPGEVDQPVGLVLGATGGIHATQPTTSAKPILRRGAVNRLPYSNDVTAADWAGVNTTRASGSLTRTSTVSPCYTSSPNFQTAFAIGEKFTAYALVKAKTAGNFFGLRPSGVYPDRVDALFNLTTGTVVGATIGGGFTGAAASIAGPDINGFYLCAVSGTVGTSELVRVVAGPADSTATIDKWAAASTTLSDCFVSALGISSGTYTAAQIQALGGIPTTTTAPASTALGPYSWEFDGTNDSLSLGSVPFQMGDDHCVIAGVASVVAAAGCIVSPAGGAGANFPEVAGIYPSGSTTNIRAKWVDNAGVSSIVDVTAPAGAFVVSARKVGNAKIARMNGVAGTASNTVMGAATVTGARIGVFGAGGVLFNGSTGPIIMIKGTVNDADLLTLERFVASLTPNGPSF
jgi:hypothetical protein